MRDVFLRCVFLCIAVQAMAQAVPAPLQNYCPVVIVNSTTLGDDQVYLLAHGLDPNGAPCYLVPASSTGVCSYVYPTITGSGSSSAQQSVLLSSLPLINGTENERLIYLPINSSGRGYFSINNPVFLATAPSANGGFTITDASVTTYNDPNFYTLYQDFEFGVDGSTQNSSTQIFMNLSYVDYFCLPMQLQVYSYPGNTLINIPAVTPPSGILPTTTRESVISTMNDFIDAAVPVGSEAAWTNLGIPYYTNPYTATAPSTDYLRVLAAKNSLGLGSSAGFQDAAYPQQFFPANYFSQSATGPVTSQSYMTTVYDYYITASPFYFQIFPAHLPAVVYEMTSSVANSNYLVFTAVVGTGPTYYVNLNNLTAESLFSGATWPFSLTVGGPTVSSAQGNEISKGISSLSSVGQLPYYGTTSPSAPFVINNTAALSFATLEYFLNPFGYTYGPWLNLYDWALHTQFINKGFSSPNPTLGICYAYDYDDLLNISGEINPFVQDMYGNPVSPTSTPPQPSQAYSQPYVVVTLGSLYNTTIPDISQDTYGPYPVTVNSAANGVAVSFTYYSSSGGGQNTTNASPTAPVALSGGVYSDSTHPFQINFLFNGTTYTYNVNLQHQIVTPVSNTSTFSSIDRYFQGSITFAVTGGMTPAFTLSFTSTPPPWPG